MNALYTFVALVSVILLFTGCMPRHPDAPVPTKEMAERVNVPFSSIRQGHSVYVRKCGECHELMMPDRVSRPDWHVVVPGMAWNAGISREEEDAVLQYILAAKKK